LFKLGLPFGIATIVALGWAVRNAIRNRDRSFLLITVPVVYCVLMLAVLPLQQPFWLMSVYPLILLAVSGMMVRALRKGNLLVCWSMAAWLAVSASWLAIGLVRVYPTFGYYGYETTGDRWLGAESRGYRRLVVVTNDGSTEALDWLRQNAPAGSRVVSFLDDVHLIQYLLETRSYPFELTQAPIERDPDRRTRAVAAADFAVVRTIDDEDRSRPELEEEFKERFDSEPVHVISRGRGIYRVAVIRIYRSS
jgi:hypothetical protein